MKQQLSEEHIAAVNRDRRVVVQQDITGFAASSDSVDIELVKEAGLDFIDNQGARIDSMWWDFGVGNEAYWPSRVMSVLDSPSTKAWVAKAINPLRAIVEETRKRGIEVFFAYRVNGDERGAGDSMRNAHPDWLIPKEPEDDLRWISSVHSYHVLPRRRERPRLWNYAVQGVRDYMLSILRELAEDYELDGIEIDFARISPVLPAGRQWENRGALTDFMRSVRSMLLEVEEGRGRPFLLSARVPETLVGCHFDGMDVETWVREELVDIFVLGSRSFDVDIPAFRRITSGTHIKLYPTIDDHHASDGYRHPPIEVLRGIFANWWHQGADGIQTFNFHQANPETVDRMLTSKADRERRAPQRQAHGETWAIHCQAYRDLAAPQAIHEKDKTFVVQRRGGRQSPHVTPPPEDWYTPLRNYHLTNMLAPLPVSLPNDGKADTVLTVAVADDVATAADTVNQIAIRLLLSDPAAERLPDGERLEPATIATTKYPGGRLDTIAPAKGIENQIELRLNNALLDGPAVDGGWLVFEVKPDRFAIGDNLIGLRVSGRPPDAPGEVTVEKLEVRVSYR